MAVATVISTCVAEATGFTKTKHISGGKKTLEDGTIYIIDANDVSVNASTTADAFTVNENSTAVLYIPAGRKLTLKGGDAVGTSPAGAGLNLPVSSKLIVVCGGTLEAAGSEGAGNTGGSDRSSRRPFGKKNK